jgi:hypothetical protein
MPPIIRIAAALETAFTLCQAAVPWSQTVLPIGGSQLAQIAILFGVAYAAWELWRAVRDFFR